jgi:hypothetical protein
VPYQKADESFCTDSVLPEQENVGKQIQRCVLRFNVVVQRSIELWSAFCFGGVGDFVWFLFW